MELKDLHYLIKSIISGISTAEGYTEKVLYTSTVPASGTAGSTASYNNPFKFTMWLADENDENAKKVDYSPYEFILSSAVSGSTAIDADAAIADKTTNANGVFITSKTYYALDTATRALYERIGAVNNTTRKVLAVSQTTANDFVMPDGFTASEQFYQYNGRTFTTTINVYAEGVVSTQQGTGN